MEETELLRKLLEQQERILSRLDTLEDAMKEKAPPPPKRARQNFLESPLLTPEVRERMERCIDTARYIPKVDLARELLKDLYDIERSLSGKEKTQERKEIMRVHSGLLNMLASVGVDTTDLPLDITTQESVLARVDKDLDTFERQARSCSDTNRAESVVDDLRSIADTLTINRKRFHVPEDVDRRLGRVIGLISELSRTYGLKAIYTPPRRRRPRAVTKRKRKTRTYVESPNVRIMKGHLARIEQEAKTNDPAAKPHLFAQLEEAKEELDSFDPKERARFQQRIQKLRTRIERISGDDPLQSLARTVESLEGEDPEA